MRMDDQYAHHCIKQWQERETATKGRMELVAAKTVDGRQLEEACKTQSSDSS
jgi:hypothetical protein